MNPFITIRSGSPFNITRGVDDNGDGFANERPTYGQLRDRCTELGLTTSYCNVSGNNLSSIVPRNFAEGPGSVTVNLSARKNFGFGKTAAQRAAGGGPGGGGGGMQTVMMGGPGGGGGGGMMRGGMGGFGGGDARKPYNLSVGINVSNLFNIVNLGNPIGSLNSSRFGQSTSTGGSFGGFGGFGGGNGPNRRIELNARFNW